MQITFTNGLFKLKTLSIIVNCSRSTSPWSATVVSSATSFPGTAPAASIFRPTPVPLLATLVPVFVTVPISFSIISFVMPVSGPTPASLRVTLSFSVVISPSPVSLTRLRSGVWLFPLHRSAPATGFGRGPLAFSTGIFRQGVVFVLVVVLEFFIRNVCVDHLPRFQLVDLFEHHPLLDSWQDDVEYSFLSQ